MTSKDLENVNFADLAAFNNQANGIMDGSFSNNPG